MNKKKVFVISLILIVIIWSFNVMTQQASSSSTTDDINDNNPSQSSNESGGETPVTEQEVIQTQPTELEPAPQWIIDKVNNYIISMVGEDYFNQYITLKKSQTNIELDKIGAKYVLTYIYTHNLKDHADDVPYQVEHQFKLRTDPDGELVEYRGIKYEGPNKPYQFLISKSEVNSTAIGYGLKEPFEVFLSYKDYVWVAWTKTCVTEGNIEGLFIDVDTGEIISKKTSTDSCIEKADEEEKVIEPEPTQKVEVKEHRTFFQKIVDWIRSLFRK